MKRKNARGVRPVTVWLIDWDLVFVFVLYLVCEQMTVGNVSTVRVWVWFTSRIYLDHVCQTPSTQTPTSPCADSLSHTRQGQALMLLHSTSPPPHPSLLHFKIAVTNCPRSPHYFWPYSAVAASAAYLRTDSSLEVCKIRENLLSKNILSSITLKGRGWCQVIFRDSC